MKVYAPNKSYTGVSASVAFCNGAGETDNPRLLEWFRGHGYTVDEPVSELEAGMGKKTGVKKVGE